MISVTFLSIFLIINIALLIYSISQVRNSGEKVRFLLKWGFSDGIFVWEDAIVICFYNIITSLVTFAARDLRWALIAFLIFWFIRGLGETIYFFLQQFITVKQYPHNVVLDIPFWKILFGNISEQKYYILTQVSVQMVSALSLLFLIMALVNWSSLAPYAWI